MQRSNLFKNEEELVCEVCGKKLMDDANKSLINVIKNVETKKIVAMYPCCKCECDHIIRNKTKKDEISQWIDLRDLTNPYLYIKNIMAAMNNMYEGKGFENEEVFGTYKRIMLSMYPYVTRDSTDKENELAVLAAEIN
ncbi:hypothetical protein K413DRAFT_3031 [Clostridium sp. ASBs410]|nr:hypothetical protein K413DRAFT_3031 [Clostridium sp. ASBs410]